MYLGWWESTLLLPATDLVIDKSICQVIWKLHFSLLNVGWKIIATENGSAHVFLHKGRNRFLHNRVTTTNSKNIGRDLPAGNNLE